MTKLLINESPLQVLPTLAKFIGLNEAIVLQQIHYWLANKKVGRVDEKGIKWVRNTIVEWQEDNFPFWSEPTIKKILKNLIADKLILWTDKLNKRKDDRTRWYTINYKYLQTVDSPIKRIAKISKSRKAASKKAIQQKAKDQLDTLGSKVSSRYPARDQVDTVEGINLIPTLPETTSETTNRDISLEKKSSESARFSVQTETLSADAKNGETVKTSGTPSLVPVFDSDNNVIPGMKNIMLQMVDDGLVAPDRSFFHWIDNKLPVKSIPYGMAEKYGYEPPEVSGENSAGAENQMLDEQIEGIISQGAAAAALREDALIMSETDELKNVFGDNPRQDEINTWQDRKPTSKDELLLHSMTGGVGLDTRHWERIINESKWKLTEKETRAIALFQTATEGFFAIPTAKAHRGRWKNAINQHLDEAAFEGRLEELYAAVWEELGPDIKSGKLTLYSTPGSFTSQMYSVMQRMAFEDSSEDKPLTDEQGALIL